MRKVCEHYGYTPAQFGDLTFQQLRILISDEQLLGGVVKMSRQQAKQLGII